MPLTSIPHPLRRLVCAIACVATIGASAEELEPTPSPTAANTLELPATIVHGQTDREPAAADERLTSQQPIVGLNREQTESMPNTQRVGDIINRLPGVYMGGPPGENKDTRLRGLDKEYTRFELDGIQLPGGGEKREFQVNRLSQFSIETVNILRNPLPEYESDGIAGRIEAKRRAIPEAFRLELGGSVGAYDGLDGLDWLDEAGSLSLGMGGPLGDALGYNLFADLQRYTIEKDKVKESYKADGTLKDVEREKEEKPIESFNIMPELEWTYDGGSLSLQPMVLWLREEKTKWKGKDSKPTEWETEAEDKDQSTLGFTLANVQAFGDVKLESDVSYYSTREDKEKVKDTLKLGVVDKSEYETEDKEDRFWQARSKLIIPFELGLPQEVRVGVAGRWRTRYRDKSVVEVNSKGVAKDKGEAKDNYHIAEDYYAAFIQDTVQLSDRLSITPGVRIEYVELGTRSGESDETTETFTDVNPALHAAFRITEPWAFHAAVSRNVTRPKFDELAPYTQDKGSDLVQGNPALDPTRAWSYDIGTVYKTERLTLGLNVFHREMTGVIEEVDTGIDVGGKDLYMIENVGDGYLRGVELEQRVALNLLAPQLDGFEFWANQAFLDSKLTTADGRTRSFKEQPTFLASYGLDYTLAATGTSFGVVVKYISSTSSLNDDGDLEQQASRFELDANIRQAIGEKGELFVEGYNLLDEVKQKTKFKANGEIEKETESTGVGFLAGFRMTF